MPGNSSKATPSGTDPDFKVMLSPSQSWGKHEWASAPFLHLSWWWECVPKTDLSSPLLHFTMVAPQADFTASRQDFDGYMPTRHLLTLPRPLPPMGR